MEIDSDRKSTRHSIEVADEKPMKPRLGRRESEPHSLQINTTYDVLKFNFPNDRVTWDLHHYFTVNNEDIQIQFDVSFFLDFNLPQTLNSYKASDHDDRIPNLAINFLSKSTYANDVGINVDKCRSLKIPLYIIFNSHLSEPELYKFPFLRVYKLTDDGHYQIKELREITVNSENLVNTANIIDLEGIVPFNVGIKELEIRHINNHPIYELVFFDQNNSILLTEKEYQTQRAEKEKQRAEKEKQRAEKEKQRADEAEARIKELKEKYGTD